MPIRLSHTSTTYGIQFAPRGTIPVPYAKSILCSLDQGQVLYHPSASFCADPRHTSKTVMTKVIAIAVNDQMSCLAVMVIRAVVEANAKLIARITVAIFSRHNIIAFRYKRICPRSPMLSDISRCLCLTQDLAPVCVNRISMVYKSLS